MLKTLITASKPLDAKPIYGLKGRGRASSAVQKTCLRRYGNLLISSHRIHEGNLWQRKVWRDKLRKGDQEDGVVNKVFKF